MTKRIITAAAFLLFTGIALSQENYTIKTNLKVEGLPAEYAAYAEQDIVTQIKGDKTKTEMTSMMGSNIMYFDGKTQTSLNEAMGNKTGFTATKEELEASDKDNKDAKPKIEYTTEKKTVAGYECTKAIITSVGKDKKENKMTVWVTDKIKHDAKGKKAGGRGMMDMGDLKGYPLEMEMSMTQNGMDMKVIIVATEVSTAPIPDSVFVVNTEGYKMVTYKEFQQTMKDARGGK